jgi:hypothetical protein
MLDVGKNATRDRKSANIQHPTSNIQHLFHLFSTFLTFET